MGLATLAYGDFSVAMGQQTVASNSYAVAMGVGSFAKARASTAMGWNTVASGDTSTAMGYGSKASGAYSTAIGWLANASGTYAAVAIGQEAIASGQAAIAMGYQTKASNDCATAMGDTTIAGGWASTAMGYGTLASGSASTAMGYSSTATNDYAMAAGYRAKARHKGSFVWADSTDADFASTTSNQFLIRATGGVTLSDNTPNLSFGGSLRQMLNLWGTSYGIGVQDWTFYQRTGLGFAWFRDGSHTNAQNNPGPGGTLLMRLDSGGNLYTTGAVNPPSDRNAKENFKTVSFREVLEKVAALPIAEWNYKGDAGTRHVGPTAQDFHAAFSLGADDKHIATVDADGVALAAIQGLNQKVETENKALKQEIAELKQLVHQLSTKVNGGAQ